MTKFKSRTHGNDAVAWRWSEHRPFLIKYQFQIMSYKTFFNKTFFSLGSTLLKLVRAYCNICYNDSNEWTWQESQKRTCTTTNTPGKQRNLLALTSNFNSSSQFHSLHLWLNHFYKFYLIHPDRSKWIVPIALQTLSCEPHLMLSTGYVQELMYSSCLSTSFNHFERLT